MTEPTHPEKKTAGTLLASLALLGAFVAPPAFAGDACNVPGDEPTFAAAVANTSCDPILLGATTFPESVVVDRSVTIQGAGHVRGGTTTISGGGTSRPITVEGTGVSVNLSDLIVTDGDATSEGDIGAPTFGKIGGGILVQDEAMLHLSDVRVTSSVANTGSQFGFGGGIGVYQATLTGERVTLDNNTASSGSGSGAGGGIAAVDGTIMLEDSTIMMNTAKTGTSGQGEGGGLYASAHAGTGIASITLEDSVIEGNVAYAVGDGDDDAAGGGLFLNDSETVSTLTLVDNEWNDNVARSQTAGPGVGLGGGLAVELETGGLATVTIDGDTFDGNVANDAADGTMIDHAQGGALYLSNSFDPLAITASFTDVTLTDNRAKTRGGGQSGQGGGLYAHHVDFTGSGLRGSSYGWSGGTVTGNIASLGNVDGNDSNAHGGGIYLLVSPMIAENLVIQDNVALSDSGMGDGLGGGIFTRNTSDSAGGRLELDNSIVTDNTAKLEGTVQQNCATPVFERRGSQVYSDNQNGSDLASVFDHVTFGAEVSTENEAVYIEDGQVLAMNSIFTNHCFAFACFGCSNTTFDDYSLFSGLDDDADPHNGEATGANSFAGDPMFVSPAGRDYHLQAGSDAIEAATFTLDVDIDGQMRPEGGDSDIGADEFVDEMPIFSDGFESGDTMSWM